MTSKQDTPPPKTDKKSASINVLTISSGVTRLVRVPWPLLILSEIHWIAFTITAIKFVIEESADQGEIEAYILAVNDLETWLRTGSAEILNRFPDFEVRSKLGWPIVTASGLHTYVDTLAALSEPMTGLDNLDIDCVIDADSKKLFVLESYAPLAQHTGVDVTGLVIDAMDMAMVMLDSFEKNIASE
jgi:hypothetical protein